MATNFHSCDHADEEDYIDMEVSLQNNFLCQEMTSPPHPKEFEFQMFSSSSERDTTTSPADELFYKGQLLPLHLPPRLQMVEKLLQNSNSYDKNADAFDEIFSTPIENTTPENNTPFESCNISPSESCQVSRELNPDEYLFEYSTEVSGFMDDHPKKSWCRKLKLVKQSTISSKLKASSAYLKSLFSKSGCSDESSAAASVATNERAISKAKECGNSYRKVVKSALGQLQRNRCQMSTSIIQSLNERTNSANGILRRRRSFSGAIKRFSTTKSSSFSSSTGYSSSSSSSTSSGSRGSQSFKNNSLSLDIENSIQSAIAHCKSSQQQQQQLHSRKDGSNMGLYSLSASRIICEDQERLDLCRG